MANTRGPLAVRLILILILGGAVLVGAFLYKRAEKAQLVDDVRQEVLERLLADPDLMAHRETVETLANQAHDAAQTAAFDERSVTGGTINQNRYEQVLLRNMTEAAESGSPVHRALIQHALINGISLD